MSKLPAKSFRGIEFIQLSELPFDQSTAFKDWAKGRDVLIKILINNKILDDCILYSRYLEWFDLFKQISINYADIKLNVKSVSESNLVLKPN
jgi:hypothetical protein